MSTLPRPVRHVASGEEGARLGRRGAAEMGGQGRLAARVHLADLGRASESPMDVHQAPVDLLSARVDAEPLLVPVDRLLSIGLFTLLPDAKNLSKQAPAKAVGH